MAPGAGAVLEWSPVPPAVNHPHRRLVLVLACLLASLMVWSGWAPWHREDWFLENLLVALAVPVLWAIYRRLKFSQLSWILVFLFLGAHELGAHYTYSEVPYEEWWRRLTGGSFNALVGWERNNFDRVIHVLYGLLLALPFREIAMQWLKIRGVWSYIVPVEMTLSSSAFYEVLEWAAAEVFGGDLGAAYLGTQGDPWDAQKDMILAVGGAVATMLATALAHMGARRRKIKPGPAAP